MSTTANTTATTVQVYQLFIKASPEQIWEAITKPEFTSKYFFGARVETTAEPGTPFRMRAADSDDLWGDETVLEAEPPNRLVVGWRSLYDPELADEETSRVTWEIERQDGPYSKLTVVHDELDGAPKTAQSVSGGWMLVLSGLKTLLETGEPLAAG